jgi:hypothetical protein
MNEASGPRRTSIAGHKQLNEQRVADTYKVSYVICIILHNACMHGKEYNAHNQSKHSIYLAFTTGIDRFAECLKHSAKT